MTSYTPIRPSLHSKAGYKPTTDFSFAGQMLTVPVLHEELAQASQFMPLAFQRTPNGTDKGQLQLVGLQSLAPNKNLFVAPNGRWILGYKPAFYRSYPFALISSKESTNVELNIYEDCLVENPSEQELALFDEEGNLSEQLQKTAEFLKHILISRGQTLTVCNELDEAGLITPWPIKVGVTEQEDGPKDLCLNGLSRVDEKALTALPPDQLHQLNKSGALAIAYAQMLSQARIADLRTLAASHQKLGQSNSSAGAPADVDIDELFGEKDELFSF